MNGSLYLPPRRSWRNKFDNTLSIDDLAKELLARPIEDSACCGTHRFITMSVLARVDAETRILSEPVHIDLRNHLAEIAAQMEACQHPAGCWTSQWGRTYLIQGFQVEWAHSSRERVSGTA
jgi:hypothetical protein